KQHQNEVNELRAERIARNANLLALVAQQQLIYHHQNHPTHYTQNSSTKSQQAAIINRGKVIVNSLTPIYDQEPSMVAEDDEMSKDKEIDKLMALISFLYHSRKSTNLPTTTFKLHLPPVEQIKIILQGLTEALSMIIKGNVRNQNGQRMQLITKKRCYCKLEAHYMYMAKLQEVTPDVADNFGPIFDTEPMQ
nr:hypothetical protein [Tanacetum cinerariifolium]